jgi:hypothetical protein
MQIVVPQDINYDPNQSSCGVEWLGVCPRDLLLCRQISPCLRPSLKDVRNYHMSIREQQAAVTVRYMCVDQQAPAVPPSSRAVPGPSLGMTYLMHQCSTTTSELMSQSLKKTFTTVLTAVKKNKQPTHTPGGPGLLRSWSGPVETDFQGRLRFSYDNRPGPGPPVLESADPNKLSLSVSLSLTIRSGISRS